MTQQKVRHVDDARQQGGRNVLRRPTPDWGVPLLAAAVALVVWAVGRTTGIDLVVRAGTGTQTVGPVHVVVAALAAGLLGWGARVLLRRLTGGGRRAWLWLCGAVLLLSLAGPLGATTPGAMGLLVSEHVAVAAVVALGLRANGRDLA